MTEDDNQVVILENGNITQGLVSKTRIYFVDYLRAGIITLVLLHHTAITYGASGSWYYVEPATDSAAAGLLSLFTNFNQAWFMGLFFLLSGYFSPFSYDHKGTKIFLKDRFIRLFIPLLVFYFILNPLTISIATYNISAAQMTQLGYAMRPGLTWSFYLYSLGTGPLWFVEMLLVFDLVYAVWRLSSNGKAKGKPANVAFPSYRKIGAFILVLAFTAYLLRIVIPINASILGFPSLFDLPQYAGLFMVGLAASRGEWLRKMPDTMAKRTFGIALIASVTLLPLALIGTEVPSLGWGTVYGYGTLSSAFYSLWDSTFAVGASMFAIGFFRKHFNSRGRTWKYLSEHFYTVYVIQAPVIVTVGSVVLMLVHIESLLKFFMAALIVVPLAWALAYPVRKIPYANRVL